MENHDLILFAIIVTSLATFISRFLGAITSEKVSVQSKVFQWFNCVAYSTLAALLGRMIIFPAGVLSGSDLLIRLVVLVSCILIFIFTKKNLVIPTIFSAVMLSVLNNLKNNIIVSKFVSWLEFSNACRALNGLDDNTLSDIGIVRGQIPEFVADKMVANSNSKNENAA